jgi:hypothetical protein
VHARIEGREHGGRGHLPLRQPLRDERVAEHARKLGAHGRGGEPAQPAGGECGGQRRAVGVVEHEQVERDVGVDDDGFGFCQRHGMCEVFRRCCTMRGQVSLA